MKRTLRRLLSVLLMIVLLAGIIPTGALAADNEWVLKSIGNTNAVTTDGLNSTTDRNVTLQVRNSFTGPLNVETGLTYEKDSAIGDVSFVFSSSTASVGQTVQLTVNYFKGADTATLHSTTYNITITQADKVNAAYGGSITKSKAAVPNSSVEDIAFTVNDFASTSLYTANDGGDLSGISISGSGLGTGALKIKNGGSYIPYDGSIINKSNIPNLVFDGMGSGTATYFVTAYDASGSPAAGTVSLKLTFNAITLPEAQSNISISNAGGSAYTFTLSDFTSRCNLNNGTLQSVVITPTNTGYGTWTGPSGTFTTATTISADQITSGRLKFTGNSTSGAATFTWAVSNEAGASQPKNGTITVNAVSVPTISAAVTKQVNVGSTVTFALSDFQSRYNLNNGTLTQIVVNPANSSYGRWYKDNAQFTNATAFSQNDINTGKLKFVGTSAGQASFTWTVSNEKGTSSWGSGIVNVGSSSADVTYTTAMNTPKTFGASEFYTACYNAMSGASLYYIYFSSPYVSNGTLYSGYSSASSPGSLISANTAYYYSSSPSLASITFVPTSNFSGTVNIPYTGGTTSGASFTGYIKITVGSSSGDVTYTTAKNTPKTFNATDFNNVCISATGANLSGVYFTIPSSSYGTLYYNYSSASNPGTAISSSNLIQTSYLSYVTFVPASNYTGTVTIPYAGYGTNSVQYSGYVKITVGTSGDVTYTTAKNTPKTFNATDFNNVCVSATGANLSGVYFTTPSSSYGTLYYNYSSASNPGTAISSSNLIQTSYLSYVTFVPASNYTGTVTIPYTGYGTNSVQYTGYVKITVGTSGDVTYTTAKNTPKTFNATDFNNVCVSATGANLSGVYFTTPSSSYGTLYYNYSSASSPGTAISSSNLIQTSYLSYVTFVPASNYTGTVTIPYTGYGTNSVQYTGYVKITVGTSGDVTYTTAKNTPKTFAASDFNSVCVSATGANLSGVYFTLPSSSYGTLYYNYSSSSTNTAVSANTPYYAGSSLYLSYVTFVPASNYTGTVTIAYTGYNVNGVAYTGSVTITVAGSANDITYTTDEDTAVAFVSSDFNNVCYSATGANLSYIAFTLPSSTYGTLYYNYVSPSNKGTAIPNGAEVYTGKSPYISYVKFVPAANYTGNVTISYTGTNVNGASFTGKVIVKVTQETGSSHFSDVGQSYDWAADAIDYLYENAVVTGVSSTLYSPAASIKRGDFILMLYRALDFTGSTSSNFSDVPKSMYYYNAIAAAKSLGIAQGENNKFRPEAPLTRQDAMVLIYRALSVTGTTLSPGSASSISGFTDKGKISSYALTAVQTLVKAGIVTGSNSKINPLGSMTRAEMAVILYRVMQID